MAVARVPVSWIQCHGPGLVEIHFNDGGAHSQSIIADKDQFLVIVEEVPIIRQPVQ